MTAAKPCYASTEALEIGSVVRLVAGGPAMTVTALPKKISAKPFALCAWFTAEHELRERWFHTSALCAEVKP